MLFGFVNAGFNLSRESRDLIGYNRLLNNIQHFFSGRTRDLLATNERRNQQLDYIVQILHSNRVSMEIKIKLSQFVNEN